MLVALDGRPIELLSTPELTGENFLRTIMLTPVGKKVTVTVSRQGAEKQVELTLIEMPILAEEAPRYVNDSLGLAVREKVDLDLYLDQSGAKQVSGLSVIGVADQSPAQAAGLSTGDVITAVNGTNVRSADLFRKQVEQSVKDDPQKGIVFMVHRGDAEPRPVTVVPAVRDAARENRPQP
jgi:S1-C subfamily serine protease